MTLPPGRSRLATRPSLTGSSGMTKTIGIVEVAALAACDCRDLADRGDHMPTRRLNQIGRQFPPADRIDRPPNDMSIATFWPSTYPVS